MKAERGKVEYEETRKRPRDTSQSSGSGNQRRRVFIPYSAVPRAPNAPKSSGYAPRPQAPNNAGGTNYRPAMGTPGSGACFTCGQPGHFKRECPHSVHGVPQSNMSTKPPVAGRGRLTHVTAEEAEADPSAAAWRAPRRRSCRRPGWPPPPLAAYKASPPTRGEAPFRHSSPPLFFAPRGQTLAHGRSPSPPFPATPRPSEKLPSSATTSWFFSTKRRPPGISLPRQSSGARAAGRRLSPAIPTPAGARRQLHPLPREPLVLKRCSPPSIAARSVPATCARPRPPREFAAGRLRRPLAGGAAPGRFASLARIQRAQQRVLPAAQSPRPCPTWPARPWLTSR
nr:uncharacterized protein LOC127348106 [Lolium perenne]